MFLNKMILWSIFFISIYRGIDCDVCCGNRDFLLNVSHPKSSILYETLIGALNKGTTPTYPFKVENSSKLAFDSFMETNWFPVISDKSITLTHKHAIISKRTYTYLDNLENNASFLECIFIPEFGYFGHYLNCFFNTQIEGRNMKLDCGRHFTPTPQWLIRAPGCSQPLNGSSEPPAVIHPCCATRDYLIDNDVPKNSEIVRALDGVINSGWYARNYPLTTNEENKQKLKALKNDWLQIIGNSSLLDSEKHQKIYNASKAVLETFHGSNKSYYYCVPIDGFGTLGEYETCENPSAINVTCSTWFNSEQDWIQPTIPCKESEQGQYCCHNRHHLLNQNSPNDSLLVQGFYKAFQTTEEDEYYPLNWDDWEKGHFIDMITNQWLPVIGNRTITNTEKFEAIYDVCLKKIDSTFGGRREKPLCVYFDGYGPMAHVLRCDVDSGSKKIPFYELSCKYAYEHSFEHTPFWIRPPHPCPTTTRREITSTTQRTTSTSKTVAPKSSTTTATPESSTTTVVPERSATTVVPESSTITKAQKRSTNEEAKKKSIITEIFKNSKIIVSPKNLTSVTHKNSPTIIHPKNLATVYNKPPITNDNSESHEIDDCQDYYDSEESSSSESHEIDDCQDYYDSEESSSSESYEIDDCQDYHDSEESSSSESQKAFSSSE